MINDDKLADENKVNKISIAEKVITLISDLINNLVVRLVIIFAIAAIVIPLIVDFVYPPIMTSTYNEITLSLASEAKNKIPSSSKIIQAINTHSLSWYYITSTDNKLNLATKPYAPDIVYQALSRNIEWKDEHYYEAVAPIGNGNLLHIGFYTGPIMGPAISNGNLFAGQSIPIAYFILVVVGILLFVILAMQLFVSKPLSHLSRACYSLLLARDAYSAVTGGGLDVSGSVTEVKRVASGLKDIRRQYDEQVAARVSKEDELKKQRTQYEQERQSIAKEYEEQLIQSKHKISELFKKEAEEEFINALSREIDQLKSSHQVCQRILDKLNDKFPNSIIYGAFFKCDKSQRYSLEAYLGFDDRSVQMLRKFDHNRIAREVAGSGKYLSLGLEEGIKEYGFQQIAQVNRLKSIIYLPLTFQNRTLGMLGIYFNTEGQTVQERVRVLRNVVELASRSLYQVIIYEEELAAARTDPLTGLGNKKFFYEIMPQVFERASLDPESNPISIIMMDGDHFKEINDTYGHQVGDQMLQELAKTLRQCVRAHDGPVRTGSQGDFLIRYGGEEFLIIMENTPAKRAMDIGERIRLAVENKHDWPGGIARWTISIGVATYPADGKNADELLLRADTALYYVKEMLGRNKTYHASQVPKTFKSASQAAAIGGELGVFDPGALLQSLATAQKTGVLTVQSRDGKQMWMLFESGRPIQARLGKFSGGNAIVEFISTFEEGNFNFQEKLMSGKESMARLPKLDPSFNVEKTLERCLMDAALAQDNFNAAKSIITSEDIYIRPIAQDEFARGWQALAKLSPPPSQEEFTAMSEIVQRADGKITVGNIFRQIDGIPTHLLWRATAILVQQELVTVLSAASTAIKQ
jgi:diguanylate cyclase (GGDEF)-like protein